jgi:hypothetical protein
MVIGRRIYVTVITWLSSALLMTFLGCKSGPASEGVFLSTNLPFSSCVRALALGNAGKGVQVYFPQLDIYDKSGALLYSGHEYVENARLLKMLPDGIQNMRPQPGAANLSQMMEEIPDFRARKQEVLNQHKVNVVSVLLEGCHGCSIQEEALSSTEQRLLAHGMNLLVIHVEQP